MTSISDEFRQRLEELADGRVEVIIHLSPPSDIGILLKGVPVRNSPERKDAVNNAYLGVRQRFEAALKGMGIRYELILPQQYFMVATAQQVYSLADNPLVRSVMENQGIHPLGTP